jgi:hypothetical protein
MAERGKLSYVSIEQLRTEAHYYQDLAVLEAERLLLEAQAKMMYALGYEYLEPTAEPVVPYDEHCYLPPQVATIKERWEIGLQRYLRAKKLVDLHGEQSVWIGPPDLSRSSVPGLTDSEQRSFWIRNEGL